MGLIEKEEEEKTFKSATEVFLFFSCYLFIPIAKEASKNATELEKSWKYFSVLPKHKNTYNRQHNWEGFI